MANVRINKLFFLLIILIGIGCSNVPEAPAGLYINEFSSSNSNGLIDSDNLEHTDWIELYNGYDTIVNLEGYYLTDNKADTTKWAFPQGTKITPNGFLVVYADNADSLLHTNFKLSRSGGDVALYDSKKKLIDLVEYKGQEINVSYGRKWDGVEHWSYFDNPTPNLSNIESVGVDSIAYSVAPTFSLDSNFYNSNQVLELSSTNDAEIRYTLNGDLPTRKSQLYKGSIKLEKTSVVRAISIEKNKLSSEAITKTFFIKENKNMPVISLASNTHGLWDTISGIYENSIRGIPRYANIEFFDNRKEVINQAIDLQLNGNIARFHGQKAMLLEANEKYGSATFDYQIFPEKRVYSYNSILLRAGGHPDKYETMFRDGLGGYLIEGLGIDYPGFRPAVVFLNGNYWGIYNMREKINSEFIVSNHNIPKDKFDLIQDSWLAEKNGNKKHYVSTLRFIRKCDKNDPSNYLYVKSLIDVDNYINYIICELYVANIDWPSWNIKFWREYKENALWKWILVDLDYGFASGAKANFNMVDFITSPVTTLKKKKTNIPAATELFRNMIAFPEFKKEFIQRMAVSLNTVYNEQRILKAVEKFKAQRDEEIPHHIEKWKDSFFDSEWNYTFKIPASKEEWNKKIDVIRKFAVKRPDYVRSHMAKKFEIDGLVDIKTIAKNGNITINSIEIPTDSLKGKYFKDIPMRLEVIPNPGYKLAYWKIDNKKTTSDKVIFTPKNEGRIEAVFEKDLGTKLPSEINTNTTLTAANSPYYSTGDIVVNKGATLKIEEGVKILMGEYSSIIIKGGLICNGTEQNKISISPNHKVKAKEWGAICIDNANSKIELTHMVLTKGTWHKDKSKFKATITSLNSTIVVDHVFVESSHFPFYSEYGDVSIFNSKLISSKTCDIINVKYATKAIVENCEFPGNDYPDTDAIDFDQISDGTIRNNTIYSFSGFNSDAIDIGEGSSNVLIEGNKIFNMTDKGVSVGQGSSAIVRNNFIYGCDMGVGIKDKNSFAKIEHNTFHGNKYGVAVFEKNLNSGGGKAEVNYCIFSENRKKSILIDALSDITVNNSISDKEELTGSNNIKSAPQFEDPINFNFNLMAESPVYKLKNNDQLAGASIELKRASTPNLIFTEISYSKLDQNGTNDWIEIYNNSNVDIDLTGWTITNEKHRKYTFPPHCIIKAKEALVITDNRNKFLWWYPETPTKSYRVELPSKITSKGKKLRLYDSHMNLVDESNPKELSIWPPYYRQKGIRLTLHGKNWVLAPFKEGTPGKK